jgi:hypothetical protein
MIERRELFKILGATLVAAQKGAAQHAHGTAAAIDTANYKPRFFSERQYRVIGDLTEIIIPADEQSPGAQAAGVRFYIDTVLHYAAPDVQQHWRDGLAAVEEEAHAQFGKDFPDLSAAQRDQLVAVMAEGEKSPKTEMERFFPVLKQATVDAFALSDIGMKEYLGYKGNTAIAEFPGCTHPEHQRI